ncbi:MAG: hypothetical protein H6709_07660 [Kofleriaceae bacterium]|nr:hypothetical protein [Kofleriaceae bacterium]
MAGRGNMIGFDRVRRGLAVTIALAPLAAGAAACGGKAARDDGARADVVAWEGRWDAARACLGGAPARAAAPDQAIALAELTAGDDRAAAVAGCTAALEAIGGTTRPPPPAMTEAWDDALAGVRDVRGAVAAQASLADDDLDAWIGALGGAIARLDAARDHLRAAIGLAPVTAAGATAPAALPAPTPLTIGDAPVVGDGVSRIAAGAIAGEIGHEGRAFAVVAVDDGWTTTWDDYAVLSVPDRSWMARRCKGSEIDPGADELSTALIAAATGPEVDHDRCVPVLPPGNQWPRPLAALGAGDQRSIVVVREQLDPAHQSLFDLVVSTDAGQHWTLQPGPAHVTSHSLADGFADRIAGTVDLLFRTKDASGERHMLLQLDGAAPLTLPPLVVADDLALESACRAAGATWWSGGDVLRRAHGGGLVTIGLGDDAGTPDDAVAPALAPAPGDTATRPRRPQPAPPPTAGRRPARRCRRRSHRRCRRPTRASPTSPGTPASSPTIGCRPPGSSTAASTTPCSPPATRWPPARCGGRAATSPPAPRSLPRPPTATPAIRRRCCPTAAP